MKFYGWKVLKHFWKLNLFLITIRFSFIFLFSWISVKNVIKNFYKYFPLSGVHRFHIFYMCVCISFICNVIIMSFRLASCMWKYIVIWRRIREWMMMEYKIICYECGQIIQFSLLWCIVLLLWILMMKSKGWKNLLKIIFWGCNFLIFSNLKRKFCTFFKKKLFENFHPLDLIRITMMQGKSRQITTKLFSFPSASILPPTYINKFYLFYKQKHHEKHIKLSFAILYIASLSYERKRNVVWKKKSTLGIEVSSDTMKFFVLCFFWVLSRKSSDAVRVGFLFYCTMASMEGFFMKRILESFCVILWINS